MSGDSSRFALDTNILVYSVQRDAGEKHLTASRIVDAAVDAGCYLTLQAVSEFFAAVTRKRIMPYQSAGELASNWLTLFQCVAASANTIRTALADTIAGRASYWDALLVATAAEAGCTLILSEDMANGARLGGVEIHNPFTRAGGLTARTRRLLDL